MPCCRTALKETPYPFPACPSPAALRWPLARLNGRRDSPIRARTKGKPRRVPKTAQKFANTCQHFLCQNAVFMRRADFF